ncbi:MAG: tetratricopeptide repeat protein [Myxococcota bacterium]
MANPQSSSTSTAEKDKKNGTGGKKNTQLLAELEQMATAPPPEHRESPGKALLQLVVFLALLGGAGGAYYVYAKSAGAIFEALKDSRDIQRQDDYEKLKEAHGKLKAATAIKSEGRVVSLLAETSVLLWCFHGDESFKEDAIKYTDEAASDDVARAERYSAEGYRMACEGKAAEAEAYMMKTIQRGAGDPRIFHALGYALLQQGRTQEAREAFKQASDKGAGNPRFPAWLGEAEVRLGNYFDAQQQFSRAVNINGSHTRARLGKALAEGLGGVSPEKILKDVEKLIKGPPELSPGDKAYASYVAAEVLAKAGALSAAEKALGQPKDGPGHLLRGRILLLKGKEADATKAFDEAIKVEPANPNNYFIPASMLSEMDKGDAALARVQAYQKAKLTETPHYFAHLGDAHQARGKVEEAAAAYKQALDKDENNVRAIIGTARLLVEKKKWEEAGQLFEKVTTLQPDNGDPWYFMCGAYIEQKDFNYASQMCDKSVELYKKRNAEPRYVVRALKRAAKAYELNKNKAESQKRAQEAEALEKAAG